MNPDLRFPFSAGAQLATHRLGGRGSGLGRIALLAAVLASALINACAPIQTETAQAQSAAPLTPAEVYAKVAPAVVFIETPSGTGSGLLTSLYGKTYVLTNEHVLWPDLKARVVFPNGNELTDVPQAAADRMVDVALLGPVEAPVTPIALATTETARVGDEVYLIGYPAEGELFPTPALARGLVSRMREWESGLTYIQTDAAIAGGQSGGVLVNDRGEVIGISGLSFGDGAFALAESSADIGLRLEILATDPYPDGLEGRAVPIDGRLRDYSGRLRNLWHTVPTVIDAEQGDELVVEVDSRNDLALRLVDIDGAELAAADEETSGVEKLTAELDVDGPVFLIVEQYDASPARFTLHSNRRFAIMDDPDDLRELAAGDSLIGRIDFPNDVDVFILHLSAGDAVTVSVDSVMTDPALDVLGNDSLSSGYERDDDSGRGIFGTNAQLHYRARKDAEYLVVVRDSIGDEIGGYRVTVTPEK